MAAEAPRLSCANTRRSRRLIRPADINTEGPPREAVFLCVPSMIDSLEVEVLYPA
jgi:hypothetical protein